jgi:hypothetical protein
LLDSVAFVVAAGGDGLVRVAVQPFLHEHSEKNQVINP